MNICMVGDIEDGGGAAIAASRLAEGLCRAGHSVTRIVDQPDGSSHPWHTLPLVPTKNRWLRGAIKFSRNPHLTPATTEALLDALYQRLAVRRLRQMLGEIRPDIINFHNIHSARWGPGFLAEAAKWSGIVWTLHDTWSFTGRCCVESPCKLFITGCDASCPTAKDYPRLPSWRVKGSWKSRQDLFKSLPDLVGVTPSRWLTDYAKRGLWKSHRLETIPHGIDLSVFRPIEKKVARQILGIRSDRPILLMSCGPKGGGLIDAALREVERPITLMRLGANAPSSKSSRHAMISMGYVSSPNILALVYSAADWFVHPTLADSFGLVLAEAIACGTPCICTPVGGCPEIVRTGYSGSVAEDVSARGLASAINHCLSDPVAHNHLLCSSRQLAEREYNIDQMITRYVALFRSVSSKRKVN